MIQIEIEKIVLIVIFCVLIFRTVSIEKNKSEIEPFTVSKMSDNPYTTTSNYSSDYFSDITNSPENENVIALKPFKKNVRDANNSNYEKYIFGI